MRLKLALTHASACMPCSHYPAARACREGAFHPPRDPGDEKRAGTFTRVDIEICGQCSDCCHPYPEGAFRMLLPILSDVSPLSDIGSVASAVLPHLPEQAFSNRGRVQKALVGMKGM